MTQIQGTFSPPRRYNVYFQDGHWLTALLTALLYLILAAALDAAGHVASLALLIPVAAGAYLLGLLMSFSRFDGFFALSHSMFVGLAWILFSMASIVPTNEVSPFLNSSNISPGLQQMRSEAVAKRVRRHPFVDSGFFDGAMQSGLENTLVHMVTMNGSVVRINRHFRGGKEELPFELKCGVGCLACERIGKPDRTESIRKICIMQATNHLLLCKQICNH